MEHNVTAAHSPFSASQLQAQSIEGHTCLCLSMPACPFAEALAVLCSAELIFLTMSSQQQVRQSQRLLLILLGILLVSGLFWISAKGSSACTSLLEWHQSQTTLKEKKILSSFCTMELFLSCSSQNHGVVGCSDYLFHGRHWNCRGVSILGILLCTWSFNT